MIRRWKRDVQGSVLMLTGLMVLVLVAVAGSSVDFGREQMVKLKLQQSSDAAALAASLLPAGATNADKRATALRYFALNFPAEYLGIPRPTPNVTIGSTIEVSASAIVEMKFIRNVGINTLTAVGRSVVANSGPTTATSFSPVDMLLVLDNSNSMAFADVGSTNTRNVPASLLSDVHAQARQKCLDFWSTLAPVFNGNPTYPNFNAYCNAALDSPDPADPNNPADPGDGHYHFGLTGTSRLNALRFAANSLATQILNNGSNSRIGAITWASDVLNTLPLTADASVVGSFLDRMYAVAATNSTNALTEAVSMASSFDAQKVRAVVLMTDGRNTQSAPLGCYGHPNCTPYDDNTAEHCDGNNLCHRTNTDSLVLCQRLRDSGVQIYTIAFGQQVTGGGSQAADARAFLQNCASRDASGNVNYQEAPDAAALTRAFTTIVQSVGKLRIID